MKCGKLWLRGTIAYVSDDHIIEYGTAIAACCYVAFIAVSLQRFEHSIPKFNQNTCCLANVSFVAIWVPILTLLSLPFFVYAAGTALPAHNTLGLSSTVLAVFQNGIGAILYLISSVVIPFLADKASIWADCESEQLRGRTMVASRLFATVFVPLVTTLIMNEECGSVWLYLWSPCSDPNAF